MSWRMHLAIVDSEKISAIRNLPKETYLNEDGYTCDEDGENITNEFYKFVEEDFCCKEDYCIGDLPIEMSKLGTPFYTQAETQELFEHYCPRVLDHNQFKLIIDVMRREAYKMFEEAEQDIDLMRAMIHKRKQVWEAEYITPYNLDERSKELVRAFNIDYQIWDVVRMYKTIDWNKDTVILFGW